MESPSSDRSSYKTPFLFVCINLSEQIFVKYLPRKKKLTKTASIQYSERFCLHPSTSTSTSPSKATTSISGSEKPEAGQACQLPGLAQHLYQQVVGHHPGQLVLGAQQHLLAPEKCPLFLFR